jgi:hypothetical protein
MSSFGQTSRTTALPKWPFSMLQDILAKTLGFLFGSIFLCQANDSSVPYVVRLCENYFNKLKVVNYLQYPTRNELYVGIILA